MTEYYIISLLFYFIFGAIVGSFLNVVIFRYNTGLTLGGRSFCFSCKKKLFWYELFPMASYLVQGGRCRGCKSKISPQYIFVEAITGLLFALIFLKAVSVGELIVWILASSVLVVVGVYDFRHKIIPDGLAVMLAILGLVHLFLFNSIMSVFSYPLYLDLLAGPILALPFFLLWRISNGRWMGLGDAKLALGIGWMSGFVLGVSSIMYAFFIGGAVSVVILILQKLNSAFPKLFDFVPPSLRKMGLKSEIPFAPFLIVGMILVYLLNIDAVGIRLLIQ